MTEDAAQLSPTARVVRMEGSILLFRRGRIRELLNRDEAKELAKFLLSEACDKAMDEAEASVREDGDSHLGAVRG